MTYGLFYKKSLPRKDSIVIGKILKNTENLFIEIFLLEYNKLAFIDIQDLSVDSKKIYKLLNEGNILSFLVIGKKYDKIQLSNKYIKNDKNIINFYNKYQKIIDCLIRISKNNNIPYYKLAKKTIWKNTSNNNLFYFYLIKMNKQNIITINYDIEKNIILLIQKYYSPIVLYNKINLQVIVKNEYDYKKYILILKEKFEELEFLSFNISKTPLYYIKYDTNFWFDIDILLNLIKKIIQLYKKFFIKIDIIR